MKCRDVDNDMEMETDEGLEAIRKHESCEDIEEIDEAKEVRFELLRKYDENFQED